MIIEIVRFALPAGTDRAKALELFSSSAAAWVTNKDLVEKYYFFSEAGCLGGGVYIWTSAEATQRWHGHEYREMVRRTYGSVPKIEVYDALLHVDTAASEVRVLP